MPESLSVPPSTPVVELSVTFVDVLNETSGAVGADGAALSRLKRETLEADATPCLLVSGSVCSVSLVLALLGMVEKLLRRFPSL